MESNMNTVISGIRKGRFRMLGRGAGRRVFDMGNGYVLKVARNKFGIIQNRNEYQVNQLYKGRLLADVIAVSSRYDLLVMQTAKALEDITPVLNHFHVKDIKELAQVPELVEFAEQHNLVLREFVASRNWGLINGKPVIIDYGYVKRRRQR